MTCKDLEAALNSRTGGLALPPEAAEHVAGCRRCRVLMRLLDEGPEILHPSESGRKAIHASVLQDLKPVRPLAPPGILLAAFAVNFAALATVGSLQLHAYGWRVLDPLQKTVVFTSLAFGSCVLAVSMVRQMRPGARHFVSPALLPAAVLVVLVAAMVAIFHVREEFAFVSRGLFCLSSGLKYAIPGALLSWLILRRGAALAPKLMGATAGGFAGLIGVTVLEVHCPNLGLYHILVWHAGVLLLSALGGVAVGAAVEVAGHRSPHRAIRPSAE
jgi:hypothetical protein